MIKKTLIPAFVLVYHLSAVPIALADVYVHKDKDGVLTFTNVPNHSGFRRVIRESIAPLPRQTYTLKNFPAKSFDDFIISASTRHSIDADLIRAVIKTESDFDANARSSKGAMGLMQLMPETARQHNVLDAYNPFDNIEGGVRHLRLLLSRYRGNLELSLAAYNAGINAVERHGGIPPYAETRQYVQRVLHFYDGYRENGVQNVLQAHR
ncbi:MAG TPA: lytic transglycosylase domain-containing protein [Candidatus Binatia bacterium]|jgi:soluble lytic murein transglycosylase-like protein